jgi:MYXO-CTERM domain-containing protein
MVRTWPHAAMRAMRTMRLAALIVVVPQTAMAQPAKHTSGPCTDCVASLPAGTDPAPLLVLLHGDGESARSMFDLWEPAASKRGIVVFAPTCPRSEGCTAQSWWKWDGDPSWLERQVDALGALRSIDSARMWIAGWSGGGTYLGWNTQAIEHDYAALVIHGGGVRPASQACVAPRAGIYFLGGDRNPLHDLAEQLHDYYASTCPHEDLSWTVLKGVDHVGERRALGTYREAILDWLSTRRRPAAGPDMVDAGAPPPTPSTVASSPPTLPFHPVSSPAPVPSSCRCTATGAQAKSAAAPGLMALLLGAALRRRQGARWARTEMARRKSSAGWGGGASPMSKSDSTVIALPLASVKRVRSMASAYECSLASPLTATISRQVYVPICSTRTTGD